MIICISEQVRGLVDVKQKTKKECKAIAGTFVIYGFGYLILNTFLGDRESKFFTISIIV